MGEGTVVRPCVEISIGTSTRKIPKFLVGSFHKKTLGCLCTTHTCVYPGELFSKVRTEGVKIGTQKECEDLLIVKFGLLAQSETSR